MKSRRSFLGRRNFLKLMGAAPVITPAWPQTSGVWLLDQSGAAPVALAVNKLAAALKAHGTALHVVSDPDQAKGLVIIVATPRSPLATYRTYLQN